MREYKAEGGDQVLSLFEQFFSLPNGFEGNVILTTTQVTKTTVHQFRRFGGGAAGEVGRFQQKRFHASADRPPEDSSACNAAADDNQVPFLRKL